MMTIEQEKLFKAFIKELPVVNGYLLISKRLANEIYSYFQVDYYFEIKKLMLDTAGAKDIYLYNVNNIEFIKDNDDEHDI